MIIDAHAGVTDQDAAIAGAADKAGRGIIIAANKWDLMKDQGPDGYKVFDEKVRYQLKFLDYAPILHISAKSGERTAKLLETIDGWLRHAGSASPTPELNRFIDKVTSEHAPVSPGHRNVRVLYAAQTGVAPPSLRAVHERGDQAALFVRALSPEPAARSVWIRRFADPHHRPQALARPCQPSEGTEPA